MDQTRDAVSVRHVREALGRLYDLPFLQTHPLARRLPLAGARGPAVGEKLHRALVEALAGLAAPDGTVADGRARVHRLLELTYVDGLPAPEVCRRMGLSKSVYYREHARGLAALAAVLTPSPAAGADGVRQAGTERGGRPEPAWPPTAALTSFIGREREMADLRRLVESARLLTLTGPPGCGKTRLARELLAELARDYPDGARFVALEPLREPALVLPSVARALGVRAPRGQPLDRALAEALWDRRLLLVLDNAEHLPAAGPAIAGLAAACPPLRVLVTSRAPLRVYGEHRYPVAPLALPGGDRAPSVERLGASPAVRLFVERARAADPGFGLDEGNAAAVAGVCRLLDGLPLAIELAAARVRLLPPAALLARLERRLPVLTGGPRDLPERHRTLRGAIAWSYELLGAEEQAVLRRLGVFVGGAGLEAASAVAIGGDRGAGAALAALDALVEQSLLQPSGAQADAPRVAMLATVREFALEQLDVAGERAAAERAHAAYFRALAERCEVDWGPEQPARLDRLERDQDNLRTALAWAIEHGEAEAALGLGAALWQFWRVRGRWDEGHGWLRRTLALPGAEAPTPARAGVLHGAGLLAAHLDPPETLDARPLLEESLALWRRLADVRQAAWVVFGLAIVAQYEGDAAAMRAYCEECLAGFRAVGDRIGEAASLNKLARAVHASGDGPRALALAEQSLSLARGAGSAYHEGHALDTLGAFARDRGDLAEARTRLEAAVAAALAARDQPFAWGNMVRLGEVLRLQGEAARAAALTAEGLAGLRDVGSCLGRAWALRGLGEAALEAGDHARAGGLFRHALSLMGSRPAVQDVRGCLVALADVAHRAGDDERAARLLGAAAAVEEAMRFLAKSFSWGRSGPDAAALRTALGAERFSAAWAEGAGMALEQAISYALGAGSPPVFSPPLPSAPA